MPREVAVTLTSTSSGSGGFAWTRLWSFFFPVRSSSSSSVVEKGGWGGGGRPEFGYCRQRNPKLRLLFLFPRLTCRTVVGSVFYSHVRDFKKLLKAHSLISKRRIGEKTRLLSFLPEKK